MELNDLFEKNHHKVGFGLIRPSRIGGEHRADRTDGGAVSKGFTCFDMVYGYLSGKAKTTAWTVLVNR